MTESQFLFNTALSIITIIKSAESIITELNAIIWPRSELTKLWAKDLNRVERHSYVLCTLQKYLTTGIVTGWHLHQTYGANKAPTQYFLKDWMLVVKQHEILHAVIILTEKDMENMFVLAVMSIPGNCFQNRITRSVRAQDLTCSFSSSTLACFYK